MIGLPFGNYGFSIAVYVISIMLSVAAISLGLGFALNNKKLKDFGKEEVMQSIINGILVASLILLFSSGGIVSAAINSITSSQGISMQCQQFMANNSALCLGYNYLSGQGYTINGVTHPSILSSVTQLNVLLLGINGVLGAIASVKIDLAIVSFSFAPVLTPILNQLGYLIGVLTTLSIGTLVQSALLIVISITALTLILPVGLILRSFYPTRKLGGFLIAISIGLYAILPLSYVMDASIASSYSSAMNTTNATKLLSYSNTAEQKIYSIGTNASSATNSSISGIVSNISQQFSGVLNDAINMVSYLIIYTFVLPAFSVLITAISIKELSALLGSETNFDLFKEL